MVNNMSSWAQALGVSELPADVQQQGNAVPYETDSVSDVSATGTQEQPQETSAPANTAAGTATDAQGSAVNNTGGGAITGTNAGTQQGITGATSETGNKLVPTDGNDGTSSSLHETGYTITAPAGDKIETKPAYLADWSTANFSDAVKNGDKSIAEYISDYNRWARDNEKEPLDVMQIYNAVKDKDISKSVQENDKEEKKLRRQQRWEQIGNLLQHLGNFVGTLNDAPGAKYEDAAELTKRQQTVRDAMMKQRGDPKSILNLLWKDRAAKNAADVAAANKRYKDALAKKAADDAAANKKKADADAGLKGAKADTEKTKQDLNKAKKDKTTNDDKRAGELQPLKKGKLRSAIGLDNARAKQAKTGATKNLAQAKKAARGGSSSSKSDNDTNTKGYSDAEFERLYSDPKYRKFFNAYATNNHMNVEDNKSLDKNGGTWSDKKNRVNALKWAKEARRREIEAEQKKASDAAKKRREQAAAQAKAERQRKAAADKAKREQAERQRKAAADKARKEKNAAQAKAKREQTNKKISNSLNKPRTKKKRSLGLNIGKTR